MGQIQGCHTQGPEQRGCPAQGVPLRLELGMKDVEKRSVMVARRDTGAKEVISFADVAARVPTLLEQIQVRISHNGLCAACAKSGESNHASDRHSMPWELTSM
jgi:prolyl-tRNA synthetase